MMNRNITERLKRVTPIMFFIILDQMIKLYIFNYMMYKTFDLVGNILGFEPFINNKYSWLNSLTNLGISRITHIILNFLVLLAVFLIYDFIKTKNLIGKFEYWLFCFLFAGVICSLIDKLAWGGSLDYMYLRGFFIFDLKDVYITAFEVLLILKFIFNKDFRDMKTKIAFKNFKDYIIMKYIKRYQKF